MSLINSLIHDSNNKCDDIKKKPELELIHESTNAVGSKEEKIVSSETKNNNDVGQMNNLKQVNNVKKDVYALITRKYFGRNELNETISLEAGEKVKVLNKNSDSTFDIEYGKNKVIKGVNSFYLNIINE